MTGAPFPAPGPPSYEPGAPPPALALTGLAAADQALDEAVTARLAGRPAWTAGGDVR